MVGIRPPTCDVELTLSEDHRSVAHARRLVREALSARVFERRRDDVVLVVSELVANALLHGRGAPSLRLTTTPDGVRVEVTDDSPVLPARRRPGPDGGWGLKLVERLAIGWGATLREGGKVVWCELATGQADAAPIAAPQAAAA